MKRVWILGAGASRALGGPTLSDLFSAVSVEASRSAFGRHWLQPGGTGDEDSQVAKIYRHGCWGLPEGTRLEHPEASAGLWEHAEEFLEIIDLVARDPELESAAANRLIPFLHTLWEAENVDLQSIAARLSNIETFRDRAVRVFAAECSGFLLGADLKSERWAPYLHWARQLRCGEDQIISFNYDLVLESLSAAGSISSLVFRLPGSSFFPPDRMVPVWKLHGSLDWRVSLKQGGAPQYERVEWRGTGPTPAMEKLEEGSGPAIGTPGPSKRDFTTAMNEYWHQAMQCVEKADEVHFCGYRMPPTDSYSRHELLQAIRANGKCRIRILLGERADAPEVRRLECLLQHVAKSADVKALPLRVEDFFAIYDPEHAALVSELVDIVGS